MSYGVPYMGSKNRIAKKIINFLPEGEVLVDLFGGGGAITHCAALSDKWKSIIYNELNTLVYDGFKGALEGKFNNENRWISREEFNKLKHTDFYVACCFSFGNDFKNYMYGKPIEPYKKAYHYAVVFNDWTYMEELFTKDYVSYFKEQMKGINGSKARRTKLVHLLAEYIKKEDNIVKDTFEHTHKNGSSLLPSTQRLERLQNIESTGRLTEIKLNSKAIYFSNQDYRKIEIPDGTIVYCDIPYENTGKYTVGDFDYDVFYKWVEENKNKYKIFISSYELPKDKFEEVWSVEKVSSMAPKTTKNTIEKIFIPK